MRWIKKQAAVLVTVAILLSGGLVTWGRMQQLCTQIEGKADKEAVVRELDQIARTLERIEGKLDAHMASQ